MHLDHVTQIFKDSAVEVENKSSGSQGIAVFQVSQKNMSKAFEALKKNHFVIEGTLFTPGVVQLCFSLDLNFEFFLVCQ